MKKSKYNFMLILVPGHPTLTAASESEAKAAIAKLK